MRIPLLCLLALFACTFVFAQRNLSGSYQHSPYTYIYKISGPEAGRFEDSELDRRDQFLHTLVDSFKTGAQPPVLKQGNYVFAHAKQNKLVLQLHNTGNLQTKFINNDRDIFIAVHTKQGVIIPDALVKIESKRLPYNKTVSAYGPIGNAGKEATITVKHNNIFYTFSGHIGQKAKPGFFKRLKRTFRKLTNRIKHSNRNRNSYSNNFVYGPTDHERKFKGFMVFNKPRYKPGDTVKLKAFVQNNRGIPVNTPLLVRVSDYSLDVDTIIATIKPYRPGGYDFQFVLSDSLDLDLDENYLVTLEETASRKFDLTKYSGDLDDEEYAAKRLVLMRGKFKYEEYELASITFTARANKKTHNRGEEIALFMKAVDENELTAMDGRVELRVLVNDHLHKEFHKKNVFLPDTLWKHSQPLENVGETKIVLPDSIFPAASFGYTVQCVFLNSNNERQDEALTLQFIHEREAITFESIKDSLSINYIFSGVSKPITATVCAINGNDTLERRSITLPALVKINPFATEYTAEAGDVYESYDLKFQRGMVSCNALRTKDSVILQLVNPRRLPVWYTIFAGKKIIQRGFTDSLSYAERSTTADNYFVSLQYLYGNKVYKEDFTIPYQDKLLNVRVEQPEMIYPGQTVAIGVRVTDANGKPVANADVTAYSFTKKFHASSPFVPYLGKLYPERTPGRRALFTEVRNKEYNAKLNWQRWSREMNLDTIEYYKFLHPKGIYINRQPAKDSITQIAPFVTINGDLQPVHLLYIDEVPVFFSQSQHLQRYSFRVTPGIHSLRLRTKNHSIRIDTITISKGVKTFISIEADTTNKKLVIENMPDTLTNWEMTMWNRYMILVENNFGENYALVQQYNNYYLMNSQYSYPRFLTGPLSETYATLSVKNRATQWFQPEGGWRFLIEPGLVKQKQLLREQLFSSALPVDIPVYNFKDLVLTYKDIDSLWQDYLDNRSSKINLFRNDWVYKYGNGRLQIGVGRTPPPDRNAGVFIKNVILFRSDNPDFVQLYSGITRDFGYLSPGRYLIMLLLKHNNYIVVDSIYVNRDGINYYEVNMGLVKAADSVSKKIAQIIETRTKTNTGSSGNRDLDNIKETFNSRYFDNSALTDIISGTVTDDKGNPVAFANIVLKGTRIGTTTDSEGHFVLRTPPNGYIVVNSVGFNQQELKIHRNAHYNIILAAHENHMAEVVVVGYSTSIKRLLAGSVAGVQVDALGGRVAGIALRGGSTVTTQPLIIVDGLPYSGKMEDLDQSLVTKITILKSEEAVAIYGSRAINGVIVIATKKIAGSEDGQPQSAGNVLRSNFRDDAYWQPRLFTDADGYARFKVTYPDDITNWQTFTIAWADKKRSGYAEGMVRSFKALSGNIAVPQFAITGDSINIIGKTLNYLPGETNVRRSFSLNDNLLNERNLTLKHSWIDTFSITATAGDSLKLKYTIKKDDGYFDGEQRSIPVFKPGVMETSGFFAALISDTSFRLDLKKDSGIIKLYAEASLLPVFYAETENIRNYEYLCNEQLASKLKAMLVQKRIDEYYKRPFKGDKNIKDIIGRLNKSKSTGNLWGWWTGTQPAIWISLHVVEALLDAERSGYVTTLNKSALTDYLVFNMESYRANEKLCGLYLLHQLGAKVDFKKYIDSVERQQRRRSSFYERLRLIELKQMVNIPVVVDTLIPKYKRTAFGNIYWGDDSYYFFENSIQATLTIYRILRNGGRHKDLLQKIRNYFLEKRRDGNWRNTYESSLILETILPDLLTENEGLGPATLTITGTQTITVRNFPFALEIKNNENISLSKSGSMPVYFTAYRQYWNPRPEKLDGNFIVTTGFEQNGRGAAMLKAGVPATLIAKVTVVADAAYVMVEIPIPAGCSYQDKSQSYWSNEVHREYFKNKVSIFCESLPAGRYEFRVSLLPRYTGNYTLNPAKAEMMYFPVFVGREAIRRVVIQ
jgi:alpha-2-macroglobulin